MAWESTTIDPIQGFAPQIAEVRRFEMIKDIGIVALLVDTATWTCSVIVIRYRATGESLVYENKTSCDYTNRTDTSHSSDFTLV